MCQRQENSRQQSTYGPRAHGAYSLLGRHHEQNAHVGKATSGKCYPKTRAGGQAEHIKRDVIDRLEKASLRKQSCSFDEGTVLSWRGAAESPGCEGCGWIGGPPRCRSLLLQGLSILVVVPPMMGFLDPSPPCHSVIVPFSGRSPGLDHGSWRAWPAQSLGAAPPPPSSWLLPSH